MEAPNKYQIACENYFKAKSKIKEIQDRIQKYLCDCIDEWEKDGKECPSNNGNHLDLAYEMHYPAQHSEWDEPEKVYTNHDGNIVEYLEKTCVHCLCAHRSIQELKAAKRKKASALGRITKLGKYSK